MRIVTYFGKGGVGKTTLSVATALACAARGHKTLLMSVTAGHNLGDVIGTSIGHAPTSIAPNLDAREVSAMMEMRAQWSQVQDYVATILRGIGTGKSAYVQEVVLFPALEELTTMTEIWRAISEGSYDVVVVDTPPTAGMMTLLAGPEGLKWLLSSVETWYRRLSLLATPVMQALFPSRNPMDMLPEVSKRVSEMRAALVNPEVTSHRLVTQPEPLAVTDGFRLATYHYLYECPVDRVFVNRVNAQSPVQKEGMALLKRKAAGLPIIEIPEQAEALIGLSALTTLAEQIFKTQDPLE
ncbi:MAG: ArsA family ATPase, partial [Chloracidobacterium sp.]